MPRLGQIKRSGWLMTIPWTSFESVFPGEACGFFVADRPGGDVLAQAHEYAWRSTAGLGALRELDFRHEHRLDPGHASSRGGFPSGGGPVRLSAKPGAATSCEQCFVESGADLAGIVQLAGGIVEAYEQRAEAVARAAGRGCSR